MDADALISCLDLRPHPEGGWFRETFRDTLQVPTDGGPRAASTLIYYLLTRMGHSSFHRIGSVEHWFHHAGASLRLVVQDPAESRAHCQLIGGDLAAGERLQAVVPAAAWFAAESLGDWSLVSCCVAPGFDFSDFTLARPDDLPPATRTDWGHLLANS